MSPPAGYYMPGLGISEFRIFIGATLTGAIAEVMCFGPNDAISNLPGMYPLRFDGNCIFATQPLTQCEDDGADEDPLLTEMDVSSELSTDNGDGSGTGNGNTFTDADSCGFYNPVSSYPKSLSDAASAYLADASTQNADSLHSAIADNTDLVIDSTNSTESGLYMTSGATDDTFARLNGVRGLKFNNSSSGTGMLQISLDGSKLNLKSF